MQIEFSSKSDLRFALLTLWGFAAVFSLGAVFSGPARDADGVYADWRTRALVGKVLILSFILLPTIRRRTLVNREGRFLEVCDRILFVVPITTRRIRFNDVTAIRWNVGDDEDYRYVATLSVHNGKTERLILFRHDRKNFSRYKGLARELSKVVGVQLTVGDGKSRKRP